MKRLLVAACLIACLFCTVACDSAVNSLSSAIRRGWEGLHAKSSDTPPIVATDAEKEAASKLEDVPGKPLSEQEKILLVKAQEFAAFQANPEKHTAAHKKESDKRYHDLTEKYPSHQPITKQEMNGVLKDPFPEQVDDFKLKRKLVFPQSVSTVEVLYPTASFTQFPTSFTAYVEYENSQKQMRRVAVIDRGNLGAWVRTAHWYYLRKGYVDLTKAAQFSYQKTIEQDGRTWVVWSSKKEKNDIYISWWKDRFEVVVENAEPDFLEKIVNIDWLETF